MTFTGIGADQIDAFEGLLEAVDITEDDLVLGAEEDGSAAAAVVFAFDEPSGSLILRHICVAPQFRRKGIGSALFREVVDQIDPLAVYTEFADEGEGLAPFLTSLGFTLAGTSEIYRIPAADFLNNEGCMNMLNAADRTGIRRLSQVEPDTIGQLDEQLSEAELAFSAGEMDERSARISVVLTDRGTGAPAGCLLAEAVDRDVIISLFYSEAGDPMKLPALFAAFYDALRDEDLLDGEICFVTEEDSITSFVHKITGGKAEAAGMMTSGVLLRPLVVEAEEPEEVA